METRINERSWVEIDLAAYVQNLRFLKSHLHPGQDFMQIVKADAYGHGAREIAEAALAEGAAYLGVANAEEGKLLRIQGISAPILILSPSLIPEIGEILKYDLVPAVSDLAFAKEIAKHAFESGKNVKIHLKIDTGMHRSGVRSDNAMPLYNALRLLPGLEIEGVFSHFSSAEHDVEFCTNQEKLFTGFLAALPQRPRFIHISNSAATLGGFGSGCNLARFGIYSFGIDSIGGYSDKLNPVMIFKSCLSQVKAIKKGESVGYNRDWQALNDGYYGIIPIGYADGYDFMLSGKATVLVNNQLCRVIGRISMDMITISLGEYTQARIGDEVILLGGKQPELRAENLAALYHGSAYELLCQLGRRARRFYKSRDHILHSTPLARRDFIATDFGDSKLNQIITSALAKRLDSDEIGELVYREILRSLFNDKDRDVHYRSNFVHEIRFLTQATEAYYQVETRLRYRKILDSTSFIVACAASDATLRSYFMQKGVEYRWLLDSGLNLDSQSFAVNSVKVNGIEMHKQLSFKPDALEILLSHDELVPMIGSEVDFEISTQTLYPKKNHQLSVFISELTRGVEISFEFPTQLSHVEPVSIFSGQDKNPAITREDGRITLKTKADEWVFPLSGVVFSY